MKAVAWLVASALEGFHFIFLNDWLQSYGSISIGICIVIIFIKKKGKKK